MWKRHWRTLEDEQEKRDRRVRKLYEDAERILDEAVSPKELKNNPFKGKPLNLDSNVYAGGNAMAYRMLKNSGYTLPWMQDKEEILTEKRALRSLAADHAAWLQSRRDKGRTGSLVREHERFVTHMADRVGKLRQKIERFNLEVPIIQQQVVNVTVDTFLAPHTAQIDELLSHRGPS